MTEVRCTAKHTKYQPTEAEWRCPKCGVDPSGRTRDGEDQGNSGFVCDESDPHADPDCGETHEEDELRCFNCDHVLSGKTFASKLQKQHNLVPCAHCKGTGLQKAQKAKR